MLEELKKQVLKEDKSSLMYCLQAVNHKEYFYRRESEFTKKELQVLLFEELRENEFQKCVLLAPYKKYANTHFHKPDKRFNVHVKVFVKRDVLLSKRYDLKHRLIIPIYAENRKKAKEKVMGIFDIDNKAPGAFKYTAPFVNEYNPNAL